MIKMPAVRRTVAAVGAMAAASSAQASFLPPELLDTAADWVAIFVLFFVPIVVIAVFWLVHILPEIIAEKRYHPQKATVNTLCLLSLVFGGMLWPLAWILAYTKPVAYRLAYGTDKHDDFFIEKAEAARAGKLSHEELAYLKRELDEISAKRVLSIELMKARDDLTAAMASAAPAPAADPARGPA
jgi:CBS domain containing-hemolysin-like protein